MKTRTVTVTEREGEELGPIDWNHPNLINLDPARIAVLRDAEQNPEAFEATADGGWPRVGWGQVLRVVMYDGWPYWKPMPTVVSLGWYGSRHDQITNRTPDVRRIPTKKAPPHE